MITSFPNTTMSSAPTYTRVAIVTGSAQGIGRAIALQLARDGLDVAVDDIPSESHLLEEVVVEIKKMGRKAIPLTCDISKEDEVKAMIDQTVTELGRLDVVRNLIAILTKDSDFFCASDGRQCGSQPLSRTDHGRWMLLKSML